jgi:predicted nucleic acid-binding protein
VILVDSNLPMYLVGAHDEWKGRARRALDRAVTAGERIVTDAEVLQEILHRYVAINRRDAIQPALDALQQLVDEILPIDAAAVERANSLVLAYHTLSARDAIHAAVMQQHGITRIMSFDRGFDVLPGVTRIGE